MPPQGEQVPPHISSSGFKYPAHRDDPLRSADLWLEDKRTDDGAEGLWRVHNDLYDLSNWVVKHPGGSSWIKLTKGTDITEAFECHHISTTAEKMLPQFHVRKAKIPRNSPYTFHENGFYRNMKKRVREILKTVPEYPATRSKIMTDCLMAGFVITAVISVVLSSFIIGAISGVFLGLTTIAAHNFFHQKDNFRMYYFDFSFMSSRDWRISHAMSHHLYTNTINDLEISLLEPFLNYLPEPKSITTRVLSWVISPGVYAFLFISNFIKRILGVLFGKSSINKTEILPFLIPLTMYFVGGKTLMETTIMWLWIITVGSFHFGFVGVSAAHHHPEIFHDGDTPSEDRDWGLAELAAVMDRHEITGSHFLVLTNFGDHAIHHMFPTVDHGKLTYLYPALRETCKQFGVEYRMTSQFYLIFGQFCQLLRVTPNPLPPGKKWKWYPQFLLNLRKKFL